MTNTLNKNVEITVRVSEKVVLIAKHVGTCPEGFHFVDEVKNESFSLRKEDVSKIELL